MQNQLTPAEKSTVLMLLATDEIYGIAEFIKTHGKKEAILELAKTQFADAYTRIFNLEAT